MKIKIFKGNITKDSDFQSLETKVNSFVNGKKVIDMKQSIDKAESSGTYFLVITVMYED